MSYQEERLQEIADAIREVKGTTEKIPATNFASEILDIGSIVFPSSSEKFNGLVDGSINSIEEKDLKGITTIRDDAFKDLTSITSVAIPSNVQTIGANAFSGCTGITSLTLAEGVQTIGANAFSGIKVTGLTIPSSVTFIGEGAFANSSLTEIVMSGTTPATIGVNALPNSVTSIYVEYGAYDDYVSSWSAYANKIVRLPAKPSTITVTVNNYLGEMVSGASVTIEGNGQTYTGTTDSVGVFMQGNLQPATYTISVADLDGFKTPESQEVNVLEDTQNSVAITYLEKPLFSAVYGVSWTNDASTTMTRTDDAIGMGYSISNGRVTSDFDNVFPYNRMKRQVIDGNTFVYVPAMWFRVVADSNKKITSVAVSETQGEGDNWYQTKPFYYGAYGASSDGTILKSVSGVSRLGAITRATARQRAMAVGTGYHQRDLYKGTILMFLWWIEFATKNSGSVMKGAQHKTTTGNTDTFYNENSCVSGYNTSTQQMVWHGIEDYIGNGLEWEDGITGDGNTGGKQYVSDNYTLYDDYSNGTNMSALSYNGISSGYYCLEAIGWDKEKPFLCQPIAVRNDNNYKTGFCDYVGQGAIVTARGSASPNEENGGVSYFYRGGVSDAYASFYCRLVLEV